MLAWCAARRRAAWAGAAWQPAFARGAHFLRHPRAQVIFTAIGFGGNGAMLLPGLVTTLGNFPEIRGMVTGLMKSVFFLCASLYTEVSTSRALQAPARMRLLALSLTSARHTALLAQWYLLLDEQAEPFLILLALLPAAAALACIPFLKHLPKRRYSGNSTAAAAAVASAEGLATRRTFFAASGLTVFIALYMAITVLLQSERPTIFLPLVPLAFTTMVLLLALYAALPATNRMLQDAASSSGAGSSATASAPLLGGEARGASAYGSTGNLTEADEAAGARASSASPPKGDESHYVGEAANGTLLQTLARVDYWCIYSMYVINLAVGLTLSNNLESIAVAKGAATVAGYVAISSVATCLGTLFGAHVSEAALDAHIALARPWCLTPAFALVTIGCIAVAAGGRGVLYLAVFLTMFGYGANLSILPATLHERYGQRHFGSIWAFSQTAMVVASSVFATGFAAHVYEKHATLGANGLQTCLVRSNARLARCAC